MILLFGGTGHVGSAAVSALAARLTAVTRRPDDAGPVCRVVTRRPADVAGGEGIEIVEGDLDDPRSVEAAVEGADRIFLLSPAHPDMEAREQRVIRAAQRAGVEALLRISGSAALVEPDSPSRTMRQHYRCEERLKASGLRWAILRPSAFLQTLMEEIVPFVRSSRRFALPGARGRFAFVDTRDLGEAAAAILAGDRYWEETHPLTGPELFSYGDLAGLIGEVIGETVRYRRQSLFAARLSINQRISYSYAREEAAALSALLGRGLTEEPTRSLERLLGRPPRTVRAWLLENRRLFFR